MRAIRGAIVDVLAEEHPATVRQVFYALVGRGVIAKTEGEYKGTVVRLLGEMRRRGEVPYGWIADNTRWMRKPRTYSSIEDALRRTAETYRRSQWDGSDVYVEVWLEKDALAGVLYEVTSVWDVPLMVTRGYPSLTFLHSAAEEIVAQSRPTFVYYFGDHDPSGVHIPRKVEEELRRFAPAVEIDFVRVAVTEEQIRMLSLPSRPTKRSDTRASAFTGDSVEVDAIPPTLLRQMAMDCIRRHVDDVALELLEVVEAEERGVFERLARHFAAAG